MNTRETTHTREEIPIERKNNSGMPKTNQLLIIQWATIQTDIQTYQFAYHFSHQGVIDPD